MKNENLGTINWQEEELEEARINAEINAMPPALVEEAVEDERYNQDVQAALAQMEGDDAEMQDLRDAQAAEPDYAVNKPQLLGTTDTSLGKADVYVDVVSPEGLRVATMGADVTGAQVFRAPAQAELPGTEQAPYVYENDDEAFAQGKRIEAKTVVLDITVKGISFSVKANPNDVVRSKENSLIDAAERAENENLAGDVDTDYLRMNKRIMPPDALKDIGSLDSQLKLYLKARAVSCRMLRGGMLLIPVSLIGDIDARVREYKKQRTALVEKLCKDYDSLKREARERLGELYNEADYPTIGVIRQKFNVQWRWLSFNISAALKTVSNDLFQREQEKLQVEYAEAAEDIRVAMRESMQEVVTRLFEQLKPGEDGKKKLLTDSAVEKLDTFLKTFEARNLTQDTQLEQLACQAREIMQGVSADKLRKDKDFRSTMAENLQLIKDGLDSMVTTRTRKVRVQEDE